MKTHWKKTFNKEYLGAHDIDDGKELKVTIKNIVIKEVKDPQGAGKLCNIAYFKQNVKPMILNVGACKVITKFSKSNFIEDWVGVSIQLYIAEVKAFGEITDALRIRPQQPVMEKPELTPQHAKWNEAITAAKDKTKGMEAITKRYKLTEANMEALKNAANIS